MHRLLESRSRSTVYRSTEFEVTRSLRRNTVCTSVIIGVRVSGFEAGLAVFMCTHRVVLVFFRLFIFSPAVFLCSCAHRWVPVSFPITCACRGKLSRWVLLLFSSYSLCPVVLRACVKLERLCLSRQAVKLRLLEQFNELGWATTCRCDILGAVDRIQTTASSNSLD